MELMDLRLRGKKTKKIMITFKKCKPAVLKQAPICWLCLIHNNVYFEKFIKTLKNFIEKPSFSVILKS